MRLLMSVNGNYVLFLRVVTKRLAAACLPRHYDFPGEMTVRGPVSTAW